MFRPQHGKYGLSEEPLLKKLWVNSKTFVVKRLKTKKCKRMLEEQLERL
jgi:hypothetical protein